MQNVVEKQSTDGLSINRIRRLDSIESTSMTLTLKAYCSSLFLQKASANQFTGNLYHSLKYLSNINHFDWKYDKK